jgi:hypothetical protein
MVLRNKHASCEFIPSIRSQPLRNIFLIKHKGQSSCICRLSVTITDPASLRVKCYPRLENFRGLVAPIIFSGHKDSANPHSFTA